MTQPLIGIIGRVLSFSDEGRRDAFSSSQPYSRAIAKAGGLPVLLPPLATAPQMVDKFLDRLDGLLLPGGGDVEPARYGQAAATDALYGMVGVHDEFDIALTHTAIERDLPTLAICRGFQLLNVLRGGDLVQHLPEELGHEGHRETLGVFSEHPVDVREGTKLEAILGTRHPAVRSSHHQGVGRVGAGLVESAFAEDGSLEGLEDPSKRFVVGVLWHPEMEEDDKRLFEALVAEAGRYRAERHSRGSAPSR